MSSAPKLEIVSREPAQHGESRREERLPKDSDPAIGKWYWMNVKAHSEDDASDYGSGERKAQRQLLCVTYIGTNYVELHNVREDSWRVHFDDFEKECVYEPNHKQLIQAKVDKHRVKAQQLMAEVQEVTAQLGVGMGVKQLEQGDSTQALALFSAEDNDKKLKGYKKALVKAKDKTLPALFEEVKTQNKLMARWMKAELLPLEAQSKGLATMQNAIQARVFNVELYSGLVEELVQVKEGKAAPITTPLSVFQRRHYMDEECLANYEAGGMNFGHLKDFDTWLTKPGNFDRLLPEPRCVVAFRIRRMKYDYDAEVRNWQQWIQLAFEKREYQKEDTRTFLYVRNGEQLWRLTTEIDFGQNLFPDLDKQKMLTGQLYARRDSQYRERDWEVISQWEYEQRRSEHAKELWAWRKEMRELKPKRAAARAAIEKDWEEKKAEWFAWRKTMKGGAWLHASGKDTDFSSRYLTPIQRLDKGEHITYSGEPKWADVRSTYFNYGRANGTCRWPTTPQKPDDKDVRDFAPWARDNVYWDDIAKDLKAEMDRYNRVVLVLQGIFDRSLALHPHPPVQLWNEASFRASCKLVMDDSRALVPGPKPDFEAYRAMLNASLKPGSIAVGQHAFWRAKMAEKYNDSDRKQYRGKNHEPAGDPGPGKLAKVVGVSKRSHSARFEWLRKRVRRWEPWGWRERRVYEEARDNNPQKKKLNVPLGELFNVSAYTPGDFRMFFEDPRTRCEYLKWAPLLLIAEDYYAGKAKVQDADKAWKEESNYA